MSTYVKNHFNLKKTLLALPHAIFNKLNLNKNLDTFIVFAVTWFVYILTTFPTVQTEDSGELIAAAVKLDIAHPPGYPLHTLLGKLFSIIIPFGNLAWRVNIMSGFFAAAAATFLFLFLKRITKNDLVSMCGSFFFAFTDIFWSQSNRTEVYSLNTFFVILLIYLLYLWHETQEDRWLYLSALSYGLSLTDHHLMVLAGPAIILFVLIRNWRVILDYKLVLFCILLFALGLSVYAYLPLRTYFGGPYDNPAFIEHGSLHTWQAFSDFVNRKIYGGTVNLTTPQTTQEIATSHLPAWLIDLKDFIISKATDFWNNNTTSLVPLLKTITREYFYLPLFFFIPGLIYLFKKGWRFALFIILLFVSYTSALLIYIPVSSYDPNNFSARPFMIPAILILGIMMILGYVYIIEIIPVKKVKTILTFLAFITVFAAIGTNFSKNNESKNYIAYDFNKNALMSVPPNGYLLSTGRDDMTFPLYYLRKAEGLRPDIQLEIYYSTADITKSFLDQKLTETGKSVIFIDLAPPEFEKIGVIPYKFIYAYSNDPQVIANLKKDAQVSTTDFPMRGIRQNMDWHNSRLAGLYCAKFGVLYGDDPVQRTNYFGKIIDGVTDNTSILNFIGDFAFNHGDIRQSLEALRKANNQTAIDQATKAITEETVGKSKIPQGGMN